MATLTTRDGLELHLHAWPVANARAAVALIHGYGEHAERYRHVAEVFGRHGISTYAIDLRGHGRSKGPRGHVARFSEYHLDAAALIEHVREQTRGTTPIFVYAHSMGGLVTLHWLLSGSGKDLAGVVLTSPFLGVALAVNPIKTLLGNLMSKIWPTLALPTGLTGKHVSRDERMQALYDNDPLNNKNATARWYTEAMGAIAQVIDRGGELKVPILLLYAGEDQVASATATDRFASRLSSAHCTVERIGGAAHELVNEPPQVRDQVIERMATWIEARTSSRQGVEQR